MGGKQILLVFCLSRTQHFEQCYCQKALVVLFFVCPGQSGNAQNCGKIGGKLDGHTRSSNIWKTIPLSQRIHTGAAKIVFQLFQQLHHQKSPCIQAAKAKIFQQLTIASCYFLFIIFYSPLSLSLGPLPLSSEFSLAPATALVDGLPQWVLGSWVTALSTVTVGHG